MQRQVQECDTMRRKKKQRKGRVIVRLRAEEYRERKTKVQGDKGSELIASEEGDEEEETRRKKSLERSGLCERSVTTLGVEGCSSEKDARCQPYRQQKSG